MSNDKTKQQKNNLTTPNNTQNNHPDVFLLAQLLPALNNVTWYLKQIFNKLALDAEAIAKMPYSSVSSPKIWDFEEAQKSLDILAGNAILRNPQQIKYKEWLIELELKKAPEAVNK